MNIYLKVNNVLVNRRDKLRIFKRILCKVQN